MCNLSRSKRASMTGPGLVSPAGYGLQSDNGSSGWDRRESRMVRKADTAIRGEPTMIC